MEVITVRPKLLYSQNWTIFSKNTLSCERTITETNESETIQDIVIFDTLLVFTRKKLQDRKHIPFGDV